MAAILSASSSVVGKGLRSSARQSAPIKASRPVVLARAAERELYFPGQPAPEWLKGELACDFGFDPLHLSEEPATLKWMVQAELVHCRWAMLGVAGILFTSIGAKAGLGFPDWYDAGAILIKDSPIPLGTMLAVEFLLFGWVETKRLMDLRNPGSQGDGSFLGFTDSLKGKENGYPGGYFDFLGFSKGDPKKYHQYKISEIKNGRLAMIAFVGFIAQHHATHKSPIDNLVDHLADPYKVTFATNGVSVPHFSEFA